VGFFQRRVERARQERARYAHLLEHVSANQRVEALHVHRDVRQLGHRLILSTERGQHCPDRLLVLATLGNHLGMLRLLVGQIPTGHAGAALAGGVQALGVAAQELRFAAFT
jgi:hypothetical protein